jgi:hypothetical protein
MFLQTRAYLRARLDSCLNPRLLVFAFLVLSFCGGLPRAAGACEQLPAGQTFRIRLLQPLSSYSSKPGTLVLGSLIESPECDGLLSFPMGTTVTGHIKTVHKVGMGFRHEVASLEIEFDQVQQDGKQIEMRARVLEVDNAREKVKNGVIQGVRATNAPQDHLSSMVPYLAMWHPGTYWILPVYRAAFPVFPEPEIYFPAGTDLLLGLVSPMPLPPGERLVPRNQEFDPSVLGELDREVVGLPARTSTPKGQDADVVNLAFIGSREQIDRAFDAAGWLSVDAASRRATMRQLSAILLLRNYHHGPMSEQFLKDRPYDFSWQKGLDSVSKRDHLRIWSDADTWQGQPIWLSASTKDIGMHLLLRRKEITHRVDSDIDGERDKIVRDLTLAGCVETVYDASRPGMPRSLQNATGDKLHTDGAIAVVQLRDCDKNLYAHAAESDQTFPELTPRPPTKLARYFRTQVLSFRDMWRENAAYEAVDLSRKAIRSYRRREQTSRQAKTAPAQSTPRQTALAAPQFKIIPR